MTTLEEALPQIVGDLDDLGTRWALVGGLAVCARAEPRPTADVDIAVAVPDDATANACGNESSPPSAAVTQSHTLGCQNAWNAS